MNSVGGVIGTNHKSPMRPGRRHLLPLKDAKQEVTHDSLRLFHKSIGTGCSHPCGICRFFWPSLHLGLPANLAGSRSFPSSGE
jgi:hypothetical protein